MGTFDEIIIQDEKERLFTAYATVEIKDKQGQFVPITNFKKAFYKFMARGAPMNWQHTNRIIGKVINGEEEQLGEYKAFKITGLIYSHDDDIPDYDEAWDAIKSGSATGVSIGGGRPLLVMKNGVNGQVDELVTVPLLEISVVENPANPLALITGFSMAKADVIQQELANKSEVKKMDEVNGQKPSEVIDLAKSLQIMSEGMSKMYSMMEKMYSKMDATEEAAVTEEVPEEVAEESKEEVTPAVEDEEVAKEDDKEVKEEVKEKVADVPAKEEEELEKEEPAPEDTKEKDVSEEIAVDDEGNDMSKVAALKKQVATLKKQLGLKKSVTPGAPQMQREGAVGSVPQSVWAMVKKEKGLN